MAGNATAKAFGSLRFWTETTPSFSVKIAEGYLGGANPVPRNSKATQAVSKGKGDDAGHLIARRFGGPDDECNLGRQNWIQNRAKGTFYQTEQLWAEELKSGAQVFVRVEEKTRLGADEERAFYRQVTWRISKGGKQTDTGELSFLNSESAKMREANGIAVPQLKLENNVIPLWPQRS